MHPRFFVKVSGLTGDGNVAFDLGVLEVFNSKKVIIRQIAIAGKPIEAMHSNRSVIYSCRRKHFNVLFFMRSASKKLTKDERKSHCLIALTIKFMSKE